MLWGMNEEDDGVAINGGEDVEKGILPLLWVEDKVSGCLKCKQWPPCEEDKGVKAADSRRRCTEDEKQ